MPYYRIIITTAAVLLVSFGTGCDQADINAPTLSVASAEVEIAPEGAIDLPIICVSEIAKDAKSLEGRVAARGIVSKVFPERRAFTVANITEGASCCELSARGCGHETIPARVPLDDYEGDLPSEFDRIIIVGEIVLNGDDGYDFIIEEVWMGGKVLLKKQA